MTKDDMDRIANDFAVAATYMQKAGFDGILVHGGHGFIITQFLSPLMNTRTDEYGGSLENRAKFPIQICKAIREAVGPDFLFELRIDGTDHQPGRHYTGRNRRIYPDGRTISHICTCYMRYL